jgi:protein SCO1
MTTSRLTERNPNSPSSRLLPFLAPAAFTLLLFAFCASSCAAQFGEDPAQSLGTNPSLLRNVRFDQRLGERIPLALAFRDEHNRTVQLGDFFGHGPVILTLVYYRCPMLCTEVLNGLVRGIRQLRFQLGRDFSIVSVSIDPTDSAAMAATKRELYTTLYGRPAGSDPWHFLTGEKLQIQQLADAVGFHFAYDPASRQFAHASGIMILTKEGILSQYNYGVVYSERDLRLGLMRAADNQIGSLVDQILLYCYHYDASTGRYSLLISRVLEISAAATALALAVLLFTLFRNENYSLPKRRA